MTSLITLGGILLLLAFGFWWAVRTGKRLNQAEALKERVDKVANVNEFNRKEDEELNRQSACSLVASTGLVAKNFSLFTQDQYYLKQW